MLEIVKKIKFDNIFFFYRGRVALYAVLKAMGIREGDEVILQAFTCLAVPNPIICLGAVPVYIDIDPKTFNINSSKVEEKITKKTKVIIVQHTFGIPAPMDEILSIAKKYNLYLIEDSCHTFGSKYRGKEVGIFGDASFYSFEWGKPLIIGLGGCAVINNPEIKEKIIKIYDEFSFPSSKEVLMIRLEYCLHAIFFKPSLFWAIRRLYRFLSKLGLFTGTFKNEELKAGISSDYQKKMSEYHRQMLFKKLEDLEKIIIFQEKLTLKYEEILLKLGYQILEIPPETRPVFLRYPLLVKNKEKVLEQAIKAKIELGDWFISPIHPLKEKDWPLVKYQKGFCPIAEEISKKIITLPIHKKITQKELEKMSKFLAQIRC